MQDGSLPPNCCTVICWSATLGAFREALFSSLAHIAAGHLDACQGYEVTNMLWAFSQLHKFQPQMAINLQGDLQNFLDAVMHLFLNRGLGKMKGQILISALLSVVNFPSSVPEQSALFERRHAGRGSSRSTGPSTWPVRSCARRSAARAEKMVQMLKPICPELGISRGFKKPGFRQDVDASQV
ncbi:unnamed protein product [Durusdinium trenchii]|uniref:Uncharacterized protein n=1 Tax=Durusdinium trenchii TaxID=1381693 RepID=A0ABP0K2C6_9DINO